MGKRVKNYKKEKINSGLLEMEYLKDRRRNIYISGEDYNFIWDESDLIKVKNLYLNGAKINEISEEMDRHPTEVAFLIMEMGDKGFISPKEGVR